MSAALATLLATALSLAALVYLAAIDPKRRRSFGLGPVVGRTRLAWTLALVPGVLLPFWGGAGGFFVWFGAVTVLGWAIAAASPVQMAALRAWAVEDVLGGAQALRIRIAGLAAAAAAAGGRLRLALAERPRATGLEDRVRQLEAEVAALKARLAGIGVGEAAGGASELEADRGAETMLALRSRIA